MKRGIDDFEDVFRALAPGVRRLTWRMLSDEASADDATAETFIRTLVRWERVRDLPHRDAWIMRVATNVAIDVLRRRRREVRRDLDLAASEDPPFEDVDPAIRLDVAVALASLPKRQREAVVLRHVAGFSEAEVADALGVSINTVKTHTGRGVASLRGCPGSRQRRRPGFGEPDHVVARRRNPRCGDHVFDHGGRHDDEHVVDLVDLDDRRRSDLERAGVDHHDQSFGARVPTGRRLGSGRGNRGGRHR